MSKREQANAILKKALRHYAKAHGNESFPSRLECSPQMMKQLTTKVRIKSTGQVGTITNVWIGDTELKVNPKLEGVQCLVAV